MKTSQSNFKLCLTDVRATQLAKLGQTVLKLQHMTQTYQNTLCAGQISLENKEWVASIEES